MVYWFTGLSGAGKTTLGYLFYQKIRCLKESVVFLDGDVLRDVFSSTEGYSFEDRKLISIRYSRLCKLLSDQGVDVVCATISMFHDVRDWNRRNIDGYFEVYVKVPMETLIERDQKGLYTGALRGDVKNVIGVDIMFEEPKHPDLILVNDGTVSPEKIVENLTKHYPFMFNSDLV